MKNINVKNIYKIDGKVLIDYIFNLNMKQNLMIICSKYCKISYYFIKNEFFINDFFIFFINKLYKDYVYKICKYINNIRLGYYINILLNGGGYTYKVLQKGILFSLDYCVKIYYEIDNKCFLIQGSNNILLLFSFNLNYLKQELYKILNFKKINIYTGKGICIINKEIKLKIGKKR